WKFHAAGLRAATDKREGNMGEDRASDISRRRLLEAAGIGGAALAVAPLFGTEALAAVDATAPVLAPPVQGLHLQVGGGASAEMVVSWHTLEPVTNPRILHGSTDGKLERSVPAGETRYTDAKSGKTVYAHHARAGALKPDSAYLYAALHDGAAPQF